MFYKMNVFFNTLAQLQTTIYTTILKPALVSTALLGLCDVVFNKSRVDYKQLAYHLGCIFTSAAAAEVLSQLIPTSTGNLGVYFNAAEIYCIVPTISALIFEYLYSKTIRSDYSDYSSSLRDSLMNYGIRFAAALISESYFDQ